MLKVTQNEDVRSMRKYYKKHGLKTNSVRRTSDGIKFVLEDVREEPCTCPVCGATVTYSNLSRPRHYREKPTDNGTDIDLYVLRREMYCHDCGKHFTAQHEIFPNRTMTADMVGFVKFFCSNPELTNKDIAGEFDVSPACIANIRKGLV